MASLAEQQPLFDPSTYPALREQLAASGIPCSFGYDETQDYALATITAPTIGPTHVGRWYLRHTDGFDRRFKTSSASPGIRVDFAPNDPHRSDVRHVELDWGVPVGVRDLAPGKTIAVFPLRTLRTVTTGEPQ